MTVQTLSGLYIPQLPTVDNVAPSLATTLLMDASGEKCAFIVRAPKAGNIRKIHFRTGAVTTATDTDVRVETVDLATGLPSGSLLATNNNVTVASASIVANSWITTGNLTADAAVTRGQRLAIVFAPTGTPNFRILSWTANAGIRFPYSALFTAAWAAVTSYPVVGLEYSDGSFGYMPQTWPVTAVNSHAISNATTPDEIALVFQVPGPVNVGGIWLWADLDGDAEVTLYDSNGTTVLDVISLDKDVRPATSVGCPFAVLFPSVISLLANTTYYLSVKPTSSTALTIYSVDVNAAGLFAQMSGGTAFHYREATDGTWSAAVTTRRPLIGLDLVGIDDAASGGFPPMMQE